MNLRMRLVAVLPTYQQLYSIPASFQATVKQHVLTPENNFLPDLTQLRNQVSSKTKMIIINNPNNPSGALMDRGMLEEIIEIAEQQMLIFFQMRRIAD